MCEWHIPFTTIESDWTERQFIMFVRAMQRRQKREQEQLKKSTGRQHTGWQSYR